MNDKAIRAAKLTASGILEKRRAATAVDRAGGQIAPSHYLPGVPRAVHADGGKVAFMQGNHPDVPPVMYHGTGAAKDFSSFSLPGNKTNRKTGGNAIYLSTSPETAGTFANYGESPRIIPAHVSAKNPFDFRNPDHINALQGALTKNFKSWFPGAMYSPQTAINWMRGGDFGLLENDNVRSWMKRRGHDGYFVTEGEGRPLNLAVFKPEQVKSAIGNQGTFDPNDPDMTRAAGGRIGKDYGGALGYVPQQWVQQQQQLAVAQPPQPPKQQQSSTMDALTQLAGIASQKPAEKPAETPSAATEGHTPTAGVSASAQAALDALRKGWTGQDFTVVSDYRDPNKNEAVGGAKGSQHLSGNAFDIDTSGWTPEQKLALATQAYQSGFRGYGFYDNNMHFDVGGQRAWGPSYHQDSIPEWAQDWTQRYIYADGGKVGGDSFKDWFGDSVTHTNGQPHVFYHGTSKDQDFTGFNVGRHGAWFTRDPDVASQYAEQNDSQGYKQDGWKTIKTNTASRVIPAYVKAENPYTGELPPEVLQGNYKKAQSDWFDTLRAKGHDAWMPASAGGNLVVALKEPQQIKSVYNSGKFDLKQKHMGKASGGEVDDPMFGHHNTSAKGVEMASGLGGIPMPSMAISKVAHPLENFGDVTLMAHPSMVTPSRDTNVWSADTYTGRQPRGDEEFSDPKAINRAMQSDPNFGHMRDITYWHDATNGVTDADEMMKTAQLGVARGIDPKQHVSFHDYVRDVRQKLGYDAYQNDHMPGLRAYGDIKRVLYPKDLFTASGNRKKPVDYTLENVMKRMKGAAEAGAEGFNYGPGNFRAIHTPKFASMGEIKSDRGLIIPSEQMKPIKSQFEDAYSGLVDKLVQATGRKGFRAYDEAADALTDISKGRNHAWFGDVPSDLVSQIRELGRHASNMPTEYFEAKSKRAIPLSAFPAALVPKSDQESARRLTEAGVKNVMQYGSPEERVAMYRSQPDLMFKNGGKAMALTRRFTKDGNGATLALKSKGN